MAIMAPVTFDRPVDRDAEFRGGPGVVRFLELPPRRCVMIDGEGAPGEAAFGARLPALYTTAWTLRFMLKRRGLVSKVGPLEGLWWTTDEATYLDAILREERGSWRWILFIVLPEEATDVELDEALAVGRAKVQRPFVDSLRIDRFEEGRVAQLLHLGPYAAERPSIDRLHDGIAAAGLRLRGRHHEIYLGNPQTSAPERLRTILRQPVA